MTRRAFGLLLSAATLGIGLATVALWNDNYAVASECDSIQRAIERLQVENERLEVEAEAREHGAPAPAASTPAADGASAPIRTPRASGRGAS
jgi:hypothetical protein